MENRQFARIPVHTQQKLLCLSEKRSFEKNIVISKNISAAGFCFRSSRPFENGKVVFAYFADVDGSIVEDLKFNKARVMKAGNYFMARVVWSRPANTEHKAQRAAEGEALQALPVEGVTQTPAIDPFFEVGCAFIKMAEGNNDSVSLFTRFVNHFTVDAL